MFSSFRALSALLALVSVCSPVLSLPTTPARLSARALSKRTISDYVDNLLYVDGHRDHLYGSLFVNESTYAAALDNKWGGLIFEGGAKGNATEHPVTIEGIGKNVTVWDARHEIGIFDEDITIEHFHATTWPTDLPDIEYNVSNAYLGININDPMSPIYSYFDAKWPSDYTKWFYDIVIFFDWYQAATATNIEFAGILLPGETVDWTKFLGISQQDADSYGLPKLDAISSQKEIYLNGDGTFYLDKTVYVNGQQYSVNTTVPKTPQDKYVGDIYTNSRWSYLPYLVVKAIYGSIPGAKYTGESTYGYWEIPCGTNITFSFSIDGTKYDVAEDSLIALNPWGSECIGSILTTGQAVAAAPAWDFKIGLQLLSSFYFRAGLNQSSNKPYYKLLPITSSNWAENSSGFQSATGYLGGAHSTGSAYATGSGTLYSSAVNTYQTTYTYGTPGSGTLYSSKTSYNTQATGSYTYGDVSSVSSRPSYSTSAVTTYTTPASSYNGPYGSGYNSAASYSYWTDTRGNTYTAAPTYYTYTDKQGNSYTGYGYQQGSKPTQVAGNLAADGSEPQAQSGTNWEAKAHLYFIIMIVLAGVLGLGLIGTLIACLCGRRKEARGPSAYRSLHENETKGTHAPLYGAEGGQSRYSDPYQDKE